MFVITLNAHDFFSERENCNRNCKDIWIYVYSLITGIFSRFFYHISLVPKYSVLMSPSLLWRRIVLVTVGVYSNNHGVLYAIEISMTEI